MNHRLFYTIAALFLGVFALIGSLFLGAVYFASHESVSRISSEIHATYVNEIIYNYKNELVSGNYRFFRNQISSMIDHEVFSDYALVQDGRIVESSERYNERVGKTGYLKISVPVWFDAEKTQSWGSVELLVSDRPQNRIADAIVSGLLPLALLLIGASCLLAALYLYAWQRVNASLGREVEGIFTGKSGSRGLSARLWKPLLDRVRSLRDSHELLAREREESQKHLVMVELTRQVAHDIRSPLATLNMVSGLLEEVEEEKRLLIRHAVQRINDIANDLLQRGKKSESGGKPELTMLSSVVDLVVSEKRAQNRGKIHTRIEAELGGGYGIFSTIVDKDIKRALSNLIDNSVEALPNESGTVSVSISSRGGRALITICDNGCGISPEEISQLGAPGATFRKGGHGLGLHQARGAVEKSGGTFAIQSDGPGKGTRVEIEFPLAPAPEWFLASINAEKSSAIVTIDDDVAIHSLWKGRIRHRRLEQFSSVTDLEEWLQEEPHSGNRLFLVDYEFHGEEETGLDVIDRLGIANESVLVTSRFEDIPIQEKCRALGVKMIPKGLSSLVPIC